MIARLASLGREFRKDSRPLCFLIKDVPKTMVYDLARLRNLRGTTPVIPKRTLDRPPTAELRPNPKDEDSLPPYEILDPILQAYVEKTGRSKKSSMLGTTAPWWRA